MTPLAFLAILAISADAFGILSYHRRYATFRNPNQLFLSDDSSVDTESATKPTKEQVEERIGNLVADDEWMGLTMELTELVRVAIIEDVKKNAREFTGRDDYKVGKFISRLAKISSVLWCVVFFRGPEHKFTVPFASHRRHFKGAGRPSQRASFNATRQGGM